MKRQKNILLALGWHDHRMLSGIAAYASSQNWHISAASMTNELAIPWGWKGDGVLTWLSKSEELCKFVTGMKIPTVDFSLRRRGLPFAHVALDHAQSARMGADHLLHRGLKHFLFYSDESNWTLDERGDAFVKQVAEAGHECTWLKWHNHKSFRKGRGEWNERCAWLMTRLRQAPKPLGVFAATGTLALEIHEVCEAAGIRVPEDLALVGVEDELLLAQSSQRPITTIEPNFEELGYQGARCLGMLMDGDPIPQEPIRIPAKRIIARQSTDISTINHPGLSKALSFISRHFGDEIDVEIVARHAGMSRRGLHQAFTQHLNRTPGEQLRAIRIEHAKTLLIETDAKIAAVARLSGYPSVNSFFIVFRQLCGVSPGEFRDQANRGR